MCVAVWYVKLMVGLGLDSGLNSNLVFSKSMILNVAIKHSMMNLVFFNLKSLHGKSRYLFLIISAHGANVPLFL